MECVSLSLENEGNGGMFTLLAMNCLHGRPTNVLPTLRDVYEDFAQVKTVCKCRFSDMIKDCRTIIVSIIDLTEHFIQDKYLLLHAVINQH